MPLPPLPDTPPVREEIARHYDNLARSGEEVGELLARLEDDGLRENTYVFVWSDHGWGLPRCKRFLYEGGIDVPLIVAGLRVDSDEDRRGSRP